MAPVIYTISQQIDDHICIGSSEGSDTAVALQVGEIDVWVKVVRIRIKDLRISQLQSRTEEITLVGSW